MDRKNAPLWTNRCLITHHSTTHRRRHRHGRSSFQGLKEREDDLASFKYPQLLLCLMEPKEIKAKLKEGWIQVIVTFEVVGSPKKHIEDAIKEYSDKVKDNTGIAIIDEEFGEAEAQKDGLHSIYYEGEYLFSSLENLMWVCINFTPASVEILDKGNNKIDERALTNWVNDILSKLHEIGMKMKEMTGMNTLLIGNMNALIQNSIKLAIKTGAETEDSIAKAIGVDKKQLEPFFKGMSDAKMLNKKGKVYSIA